jgi:hypothetical protein
MIARRKLLIGLTWGALIARFTANGRVPAAAAQRNTGQRDNCSFVADRQASLQRAIARGEERGDAQWRAVCPLCGDHLTISAERVS